MKSYHLHLLHFLKQTDHVERTSSCIKMQEAMAEDGFLDRVVFNDESMFHLSGKVHEHNVYTWGAENSHAIVQHKRASPEVNVFCAMSTRKIYDPFFFREDTVRGTTDMALP
jgi:hypothetical protein